MGEDEFKSDFDDDKGDNETDIGFDIDAGEEIDDGGGEHGDGNPSIVHSFGGGSVEGGRIDPLAGMTEVASEGVFKRDASDENN